jgi:Zn-dependent protease/predicted transcriptional regulator
MGSSIKLGKILGIPIGVNYSWFLIFFLVTYSLVMSLDDLYPRWSTVERWGVSLTSSALLFASVVAHELSHSLLALGKGIPVKGITLFLFGGVSQISREATSPGAEFLIAVVGPLSSILLGLLFWGLHYLVEPFSVHLAVMTQLLFGANVLLGVFNMIPGYPMDGGRVFRAAIWTVSGSYSAATRIATITGQMVALGFVALGGFVILGEEYLPGAWLALIGWFLWNAASVSFRQFRQHQRLEGYVSRDLMSIDCPEVSPETSLGEVPEGRTSKYGWECLVVGEDGRVRGLINHQAIKRVGKRARDTTRVLQVMTPLEEMETVRPEEDAHRAMDVLNEGNAGLVPVVDGGEVIGVVFRDSLTHLMEGVSKSVE